MRIAVTFMKLYIVTQRKETQVFHLRDQGSTGRPKPTFRIIYENAFHIPVKPGTRQNAPFNRWKLALFIPSSSKVIFIFYLFDKCFISVTYKHKFIHIDPVYIHTHTNPVYISYKKFNIKSIKKFYKNREKWNLEAKLLLYIENYLWYIKNYISNNT